MPETATLTLVPPPQLADAPDKGVSFLNYLAEDEDGLRAEAKAGRKRFIGPNNLRNQKWWALLKHEGSLDSRTPARESHDSTNFTRPGLTSVRTEASCPGW